MAAAQESFGERGTGRSGSRLWAVLALALGGCAAGPDLGAYTLTESAGVRDAPWPSLVDVPTPPPPGTWSAAVPDPAGGAAVLAGLAPEAARMKSRAARLAAPVLTEAERGRLQPGRR